MAAPSDRRIEQEDAVLTGPTQAVAHPTTPHAPSDATGAPQTAPDTSEEELALVLASLQDDKAEDIVQIDLRGRSSVADWMVVASGRSSRQVTAIAEKLVTRLKQDHGIPAKLEGKDAGDWVLIDAGDVIVHVFRPEVRAFYQLEKMWMPTGATQA